MRKSNLLYCDFETQSALNLRTVGTKQYLEHPSTRVMSGVFMDTRNKVTIWIPTRRRRISVG